MFKVLQRMPLKIFPKFYFCRPHRLKPHVDQVVMEKFPAEHNLFLAVAPVQDTIEDRPLG